MVFGSYDFRSTNQRVLLDSTSVSMSDELMSKTKTSDFQFFIDFQSLNQILLKGFHEGMHAIDRKCTSTNHYSISFDQLLDSGYLLKQYFIGLP